MTTTAREGRIPRWTWWRGDRLFSVLLCSAAAAVIAARPAWGDPSDEAVPGELLVQFTPDAASAAKAGAASASTARTGRAAVDQALNALGADELEPILDRLATPTLRTPGRVAALAAHGLDRVYRVRYRSGEAPADAARRLEASPDVVYAEPNYRVSIAAIPNDPLFPAQWPHNNVGQATRYGGGTVGTPDADLDTMEAWDIETGSPSVIIAIIDTGIDLGHPEFAGRLVPGYDIANNDSDPSDDNFHGTACAGVAAAAGNNGLGVAGVAWNVRLLPVKIFDSNGSGTSDDAAIGIAWAASQGAPILSLSFRVSPTQTLANALNYALGQGSAIFAAAGNWRILGGGDPSIVEYPASHPGVIAVGAMSPCNERKSLTSCDGENYWQSHYGSALAFLTPGVRIHTTDMRGNLGYNHSGDYLDQYNGTSAATPYAAGVAALVLSYNPNLSNTDLRAVLERTADDLGPPGWDPEHGWGRLNAHRALLQSCNCDDGNPCTDDNCNAGQCVHVLASRCLAPILSLLLDGDVCGEGVVDAGETCDDGNTASGDGCSTSCQVESCFSCGGAPSTCSPIATCTDGDGCCLAACVGQDSDCAAPTSSTPIAGTKLRLSDGANPRTREIKLLAKDPGIGGVDINPLANGAYLQIYNPGTGESACVSLPNTNGTWRASGTGPNVSYRYKDSRYANGPCKLAAIRRGSLKALCRATVQPIPYTLDEPQQGSVGMNLISSERTFCALFGGTITSDIGTSVSSKGRFAALNAPAPAMCPVVPTTCP